MLGVIVQEDADERATRETPSYQTTVTWWSCLELKYSKRLEFHEDIFEFYQLYATATTYGTNVNESLVIRRRKFGSIPSQKQRNLC